MPDLPHTTPTEIPFHVKRVSTTHDSIEVTLCLTRAFAEQLTLIAAPMMQDILKSVERQKQRDDDRQASLLAWQNEKRRLNLLGLRLLRQSRKSSESLEILLPRFAMRHDVAPEALRSHCHALQRKRHQRLSNLQSIAMCRMYLADAKKKQIAKRFGVTIWVVSRTLDEWLPRIETKRIGEVRHG